MNEKFISVHMSYFSAQKKSRQTHYFSDPWPQGTLTSPSQAMGEGVGLNPLLLQLPLPPPHWSFWVIVIFSIYKDWPQLCRIVGNIIAECLGVTPLETVRESSIFQFLHIVKEGRMVQGLGPSWKIFYFPFLKPQDCVLRPRSSRCLGLLDSGRERHLALYFYTGR